MEKGFELKKYIIESVLIVLLLADLFVKALPIVPFSLLILMYIMIRCNYWELSFLLLVFFPAAFGYVLNTVGRSGLGGWSMVLGVLFVGFGILSGKAKMKKVVISVLPFLIVMILFLISAITTTGGDYAMTKVRSTFITGSMAMVAYVFLYSNCEKFDMQRIGVFYILLTATLLRLSFVTNNIPGPSGLFDFNFLRYQTQDWAFAREEEFHISYQNTAFVCVQGIGFFLMSRFRKMNWNILIMLLLSALVVFYTGSRQAVVTVVFMLGLWFLQSRGRGVASGLIVPLLGLGFVFYMFQTLTSDEGLLYSVSEAGYIEGSGRGPWIKAGIEQFLEHPIWGVGFGRYNIWGYYGTYPHNFFVEVLCEIGIVGAVIVIGLSLMRALANKESFMMILYLFLAIFFRSMASTGLNSSIVMLVMLFALPALKSESTEASSTDY